MRKCLHRDGSWIFFNALSAEICFDPRPKSSSGWWSQLAAKYKVADTQRTVWIFEKIPLVLKIPGKLPAPPLFCCWWERDHRHLCTLLSYHSMKKIWNMPALETISTIEAAGGRLYVPPRLWIGVKCALPLLQPVSDAANSSLPPFPRSTSKTSFCSPTRCWRPLATPRLWGTTTPADL